MIHNYRHYNQGNETNEMEEGQEQDEENYMHHAVHGSDYHHYGRYHPHYARMADINQKLYGIDKYEAHDPHHVYGPHHGEPFVGGVYGDHPHRGYDPHHGYYGHHRTYHAHGWNGEEEATPNSEQTEEGNSTPYYGEHRLAGDFDHYKGDPRYGPRYDSRFDPAYYYGNEAKEAPAQNEA